MYTHKHVHTRAYIQAISVFSAAGGRQKRSLKSNQTADERTMLIDLKKKLAKHAGDD